MYYQDQKVISHLFYRKPQSCNSSQNEVKHHPLWVFCHIKAIDLKCQNNCPQSPVPNQQTSIEITSRGGCNHLTTIHAAVVSLSTTLSFDLYETIPSYECFQQFLR